ncbi:TetR/AcrR family transcriptional regulator [Allonocardiopsis opalescens]|uniref:TetR family transcriptional regulator n=1 Tax=Allonocardiopsis opalescens TaxID=1144618 RepID=A0A2T0Q704_9ACTN|nr:TetR/AcrR family transcriptional regulator [Allonocardiopsis opalescens]PRX99592.1 TetR family transcriptional regulator [Allonocardiopsis opalescens]
MVQRPGLSRDRIINAAVTVADNGGLSALSMRSVGRELGVEAMSLYHHFSGKDEILAELADWPFTQIDLPAADQPWWPAMIRRAASARRVLFAHPWALGLIESRRDPGPAVLRHHDAVLGCLRRNGFSVALAAHAFSALDAYVYGFVLTELNLPFKALPDEAAATISGCDISADAYPHLAELSTEMVTDKHYAYADEFAYGLDLILTELQRRHSRRSE